MRSRPGSGQKVTRIDAGVDDPDRAPGHTARHEVVPGAFADGVETGPAIGPRNRPLRSPDDGRLRPGGLLERGGAEEVRDDHAGGDVGEPGAIERQLVDVLDQYVRTLRGEGLPDRAAARPA